MEGDLELALKMFSHYDCQQQTLISKQRLTDILNKQATNNIHHAFSPQIIEEIWGQAETTSRGEATALTFSKIYVQAISILEKRIALIDGPTGIPQNQDYLILQQVKLADLEDQYEKGYAQNYDRINTARKNIVVVQNKIQELQKNRIDFQKELVQMKACLHVQQKAPSSIIQRSQVVHYVSNVPSEPQAPSIDLSQIFKATVLGVCMQMLFMSFHPSFLVLICYLLILYWLFLGYYDQYFVKLLIAGLLLSCLMDLIYICLVFIQNIGSYRFYDEKSVWRFIAIAFSILQIVIRGFLILKLSTFKQPTAKKQYFLLFGRQIELHARSGKVFSSRINHD